MEKFSDMSSLWYLYTESMLIPELTLNMLSFSYFSVKWAKDDCNTDKKLNTLRTQSAGSWSIHQKFDFYMMTSKCEIKREDFALANEFWSIKFMKYCKSGREKILSGKTLA